MCTGRESVSGECRSLPIKSHLSVVPLSHVLCVHLFISLPSFHDLSSHHSSNNLFYKLTHLNILISSSLPSVRSGLSAGSRHLPAAARGEACHTSTSALWEENGRTSAWERGQNHRETGLPARLQHPQMYDRSTCETLNHIVLAVTLEIRVWRGQADGWT